MTKDEKKRRKAVEQRFPFLKKARKKAMREGLEPHHYDGQALLDSCRIMPGESQARPVPGFASRTSINYVQAELGVAFPKDISDTHWAIPVLVTLLDKVKGLEEKLELSHDTIVNHINDGIAG